MALLSNNRPEWLVTDFSCVISGLISVPLHVNASKKDQSYMIHQTEAKVLVVEKVEMLKKLKLAELEFVICMQPKTVTEAFDFPIPVFSFEEVIEESQLIDKAVEVSDSDPLTIVYTSGTTGLPKGVVHSYGTVFAAIENAKYLL